MIEFTPMDEKRLEKIKVEFGRRVKEIRSDKGLTQLDLAEKIGSDIRQIQRIENAEVTTSIAIAFLIAKALDVPIEELLGFKV